MSYFFGLETDGLSRMYIYEGHMEEGVVKIACGTITEKYDCVLNSRIINYSGEYLTEIKRKLNYHYYDDKNLTGYFKNNCIEHRIIKIEDSIANEIIKFINEIESEDPQLYIKTKCENLLLLPPGEYSHELTKILGHVENSMDNVYQSIAYKLLYETIDAYKANKLKLAQETNEPVLIYDYTAPVMYGERGYLNQKEYVHPDGHTEKKEQYTNG